MARARHTVGLRQGSLVRSLLLAGCIWSLEGPGAVFCGLKKPRSEPSAALARHAENPRLYRAATKIKVRMEPDIKSPSLKDAQSQKIKSREIFNTLREGQVFEVTEVRQSEGQTYLKLAEQDGWVFTKGVKGQWAGKEIVQLVPESEVVAAKEKSVSDATAAGTPLQPPLTQTVIDLLNGGQDGSDAWVYIVGVVLFLLATAYKAYEYFS